MSEVLLTRLRSFQQDVDNRRGRELRAYEKNPKHEFPERPPTPGDSHAYLLPVIGRLARELGYRFSRERRSRSLEGDSTVATRDHGPLWGETNVDPSSSPGARLLALLFPEEVKEVEKKSPATIWVNPAGPPNQQVRTGFHELAHATLNVLGRGVGKYCNVEAAEEAVAETVAYLLSQEVGLRAARDYSVGYVSHWLVGAPDDVWAALDGEIRRTYDYLSPRLRDLARRVETPDLRRHLAGGAVAA